MTEYLVMLLVALISVLITPLVFSARKKHKETIFQKRFKPITVNDNSRKRYFSWSSRDPVDLIENEGQGQQIQNLLAPLRDVIQQQTNMKLQFSFPDKLQGEILYELSSDFKLKWRLLGGNGGGQGNQVLVIVSS